MQDPQLGFLRFDELADGQGDLALSLEYDSTSRHLSIEACAPLPEETRREDLAAAYFSLCDLDSLPFRTFFSSESSTTVDHTRAVPL